MKAVFIKALLLALILVSTVGHAQWKLPLFTADPREVLEAARQSSGPRDTGAYLIDLETNIRLDESGKVHWIQRDVIRILDDRGVRQFGMLVIPWVGWRQDRPKIRARVITRDGRAHDLEASTIVDGGFSHAGSQMLSDTRAVSAALPAVQPDSVIEAEVEVDDKSALFPGGQFFRYPVTQAVAVLHYRVTVEAPANSPFQAVASGFDPAPASQKEEQTPGTRKITFEGVGLPTPHAKAMLSPDVLGYPTISISSGATWRGIASWYARIVDERAGPPASNTAARDAAARVAAILADIQSNVRYTGMELGSGAYIPRTPEETLKRGFGDCKDKSVLLVSRLRAEGIPAFVALLTPYPASDVDPAMPGIENFAHAIVYVPGQHPIWIDPTAEFTPATRLPFVDQGRWALIASAGSTQLVRTPESQAIENLTRYDITVTLQPDGEGNFQMAEQESGAFEEMIRPIAALTPERVREAKGTGLKRKINVDFADPRDLQSPYRMSVSGEGYDAARTDGTRAWADISPLGVDTGFLSGLMQDSSLLRDGDPTGSPRTQDYCFPVTFTEEMDKRIVPPEGFRLRWPPALPWKEIGPLTLARSVKVQADGSVLLSFRLTSPKRCYTVSEARIIAQEIHKLSTSRDATVRVEFFRDGK